MITTNSPTTIQVTKINKNCKCGSKTHKTSKSLLCPLNKKNKSVINLPDNNNLAVTSDIISTDKTNYSQLELCGSSHRLIPAEIIANVF